ncbi:hypothetical protein Tco_0312194 [Tanacetum coccineum]
MWKIISTYLLPPLNLTLLVIELLVLVVFVALKVIVVDVLLALKMIVISADFDSKLQIATNFATNCLNCVGAAVVVVPPDQKYEYHI